MLLAVVFCASLLAGLVVFRVIGLSLIVVVVLVCVLCCVVCCCVLRLGLLMSIRLLLASCDCCFVCGFGFTGFWVGGVVCSVGLSLLVLVLVWCFECGLWLCVCWLECLLMLGVWVGAGVGFVGGCGWVRC